MAYFVRNLLLASENAEELEALRCSALRRFGPRDLVEGEMVEQYLMCAWRLKRLRKAEMGIYQQRQAAIQQRLIELAAREGLAGDEGMATLAASAELVLEDLLYEEAGVLERISRYEQRMFNSMLRCTRELRALQKEEIEDIADDMQNEPNTAAHLQNQPTADADDRTEATAEADAQNEPTAPAIPANPSTGQQLPSALDLPLTPQAAKLIAATEKVLQDSLCPKLKAVV